MSRDPNEVIQEQETFGNRVADKVASFGGSWAFISLFGLVLVAWVLVNTVWLGDQAFDGYPFILLNLVLSMLAAIQAPIISLPPKHRRPTPIRFVYPPHQIETNAAETKLVCSPKTGPGGMRVSEAQRGQETHYEATHG